MLRNRRSVVWGIFLMRGFLVWLMALQLPYPATRHANVIHMLFSPVGSMHCFSKPVNKQLLEILLYEILFYERNTT